MYGRKRRQWMLYLRIVETADAYHWRPSQTTASARSINRITGSAAPCGKAEYAW